jgi:hypothetical protein
MRDGGADDPSRARGGQRPPRRPDRRGRLIVGRRARRRRAEGTGSPAPLDAPTAEYADGDTTLVLRGVLTAKTRAEYARVGEGGAREDAWQRSVEFLFERLALRWAPAGVPYEGPKELLGRFRAASPEERAWVRDRLREHLAEFFPDVAAP